MNKDEKKVVKTVLENHKLGKTPTFTKTENEIVNRLIVFGILNEEAFTDLTAMNDSHKIYIQNNIVYPLTSKGQDNFRKNWYLQFREAILVIFIRDLLVIISFIASAWLVYLQIQQMLQKQP